MRFCCSLPVIPVPQQLPYVWLSFSTMKYRSCLHALIWTFKSDFFLEFFNLLESFRSNMFSALSEWCHIPDVIDILFISLTRPLMEIMHILRPLWNNTAISCPAWQRTVQHPVVFRSRQCFPGLIIKKSCENASKAKVKLYDNVTALPLSKRPILDGSTVVITHLHIVLIM